MIDGLTDNRFSRLSKLGSRLSKGLALVRFRPTVKLAQGPAIAAGLRVMNRVAINHFKTVALPFAIGCLCALLGFKVAGPVGLAVGGGLYILLAWTTLTQADRMILRIHGARLISERDAPGLYGMVRELARRADLPTPKIYLIPEAAPNIFTTGRRPHQGAIALTRGLLDILSGEELAAVIAHEISHLRCGDTLPLTIVAAVAALMISASNFLSCSNLLRTNEPNRIKNEGVASDTFFWILIAPITAALIRLTAYASREAEADESSVHLIGEAGPLCRALRKIQDSGSRTELASASPATAHLFISSPLTSAGLMGMFQTHPPLDQRIEKLGDVEPSPNNSMLRSVSGT